MLSSEDADCNIQYLKTVFSSNQSTSIIMFLVCCNSFLQMTIAQIRAASVSFNSFSLNLCSVRKYWKRSFPSSQAGRDLALKMSTPNVSTSLLKYFILG